VPPPLPRFISDHTRLPVIAAPMFLVSGPDLVLASCRAGVVGSFPAPNARTLEDLDAWMARLVTELAAAKVAESQRRIGPWAANIVVHRSYARRTAELELILKHRPPIVITALGSPRDVIEGVHAYGGLVLADVNSVSFARKAADTGVDGLVLVAAGAGGHTGQISGFAFVEAVRAFWDKLVVLGGGISTGRGVRAAQTLGADLAYLGTRFIATTESLASDDYRQMLVDSSVDDIVTSAALTGVPANWLRASLLRNGFDAEALAKKAAVNFTDPHGAKAWKDTWSAGQGVGMVRKVLPTAALVDQLVAEYAAAVHRERGEDPWSSRVVAGHFEGDE
jgi:nitronate monooxygenase